VNSTIARASQAGVCHLAYNDFMRRVVAITAFALLLSVPVWAQHGGGGHAGGFGGGGHVGGFGGGHVGGFGGHVGSFSGGHAGFSGSPGVHAFSGSRSVPGYSRGFSHLPPTYGFNHPPTYGFNPPTSGFARQPFANNRFGSNGFGRNRFNRGIGIHIGTYPYCWGCWAYGYPWWDAGYFDPWWWWWDSQGNNDNNDDYNNNLATAEQMNEQSLEQQQMLRQEEADGDQDAYNQPGYDQQDAGTQRNAYAQEPYVRPPLDPQRMAEAQQRNHTQTADSTMRPTVLVFRDQHKEEVENYAIVGQTLWNFTAQQTVKIPLSELDVPATIKTNQDRGVTFTVPSSDQGG
jgi:hypothetical protein